MAKENSSEIVVKCNLSLAESLINQNKQEIANLENNYGSKIKFIFDNQFSLHEPVVDSFKNLSSIKDEKAKKQTTKRKTKVEAKKRNPIKKKIIKTKKEDKSKKLENIETTNENKTDGDIEEKTGWWS